MVSTGRSKIGNARIVSCKCENDISIYSDYTDYNKMNIIYLCDFIITYW